MKTTRINNLDLNNDNYIDYIKVIDYVDGNVHTIVLQAYLTAMKIRMLLSLQFRSSATELFRSSL